MSRGLFLIVTQLVDKKSCMIQTGKFFTILPIIKGLRFVFSQVFCTLSWQEVYALAGGRTMRNELCVWFRQVRHPSHAWRLCIGDRSMSWIPRTMRRLHVSLVLFLRSLRPALVNCGSRQGRRRAPIPSLVSTVT